MPPLRKNLALALDGGGIKGIMVARALMEVEQALGEPLHKRVRLAVGTSTGSIIAAGLALGMSAEEIFKLYHALGAQIFPKSWRTLPGINLLVPFRYPAGPLEAALAEHFGEKTLGDLNRENPDFTLVVTATDVYANKTRFIKSNKARYAHWKVRDVVRASAAVPTYFPVFEHRYSLSHFPPSTDEYWIPEPRIWVDGGVGSYSNPCYMAAYEIAYGLIERGWNLGNSTLISIGTGRDPLQKAWSKITNGFRRSVQRLPAPDWILPTIQLFMLEADYQQMRLVRHFFVDSILRAGGAEEQALDFRRYNTHFSEPIGPDAVADIEKLVQYGIDLGWMILNNMQEDIGGYGAADSQPTLWALPISNAPSAG